MDIERTKQILNDSFEPLPPTSDLWNTWESKKRNHTLEFYFIRPSLLALYNEAGMTIMELYAKQIQLFIL